MTSPARFGRLVHTGNVLVDVVLRVPSLPVRGGDVVARSASMAAGAGFNVMAAAVRLGLPTVYAGLVGTGPRADHVTSDLAAEGIEVAFPVLGDVDTGFVTVLVEPDGERSFVTSFGAELDARRPDVAGIVQPGDAVFVSGYSMLTPVVADSLLATLTAIPADVGVVFDPGPLISSLSHATLSAVLDRTDVLTCNAHEAALLADLDLDGHTAAGDRRPDGGPSVDVLTGRLRARAPRALIVVRRDADGAAVAVPGGGSVVTVPAVPVDVVDTNGAGDAHSGALLAALSRGESPVEAVHTANAAAAYAVSRPGPATGPTTAQLAQFRAARSTLGPSPQS